MKIDIAVLMSVYKNDRLEYIKESLESLYNQSFSNFDILIQCDGDLSNEMMNYLDLQLSENKIKILRKRDINKGLAYSLNELIVLALKLNYEYFIRMDADDICVKNRIKIQYEIMSNNPSIDVCGGFIEEFNMDNNEKQIIYYPENNKEILTGMQKRNSLAHVTTCIRKRFFQKVGLYDDSKKNEDLDLWIRGFQKDCKFYNIQNVLVQVRTNNAFFNRRKDFTRAKEVMRLKFKATKFFGFGVKGYFYAVAHFLLFMMPSSLKQFIYKNMR